MSAIPSQLVSLLLLPVVLVSVAATRGCGGSARPGNISSPVAAVPVAAVNAAGISDAVLAASKPMAGARVTGPAAINLPDLLAEVEKNGAEMHRKMLDFTYHHRKLVHWLNDKGQPVEETFQDYEAYPARGRHVLIKIADRGTPLPNWEIQRERKRAGEELELAGGSALTPNYITAALSGSYRGKSASLLIDPVDFLRASMFSGPRYELFGERKMVVLDFTPRQGADLALASAFVANLTGTIWIDAIDKTLVRIEARNLKPGIGKNGKPLPVSPDPKLIYQQTRLPSGEWFPAVIRLNTAGDASAFHELMWDVVFEFKNYQRFNTNAEQIKIGAPDKTP